MLAVAVWVWWWVGGWGKGDGGVCGVVEVGGWGSIEEWRGGRPRRVATQGVFRLGGRMCRGGVLTEGRKVRTRP